MQITTKKQELFRRARRVAVVVLAIGVIISLMLTTLTSCSFGNNTSTPKPSAVHSDSYAADFANNLKLNVTAREYFTAAVYGYNMTVEGFNDADIDITKLADNPDMDAVRAILLNTDADWSIRPENSGEEYVRLVKGEEVTSEVPVLDGNGEPVLDDEGNPVTEEVTVTVGGLTAEDAIAIRDRMATDIVLENSGTWDTVMRGIGTVLKWVSDHLAFHNYLLALFIFAIAIEIVLLPFGIRQQKNTIKQAKLRPKEMAIRNKYKGRNDQATQQKLNAEIQELYQKENFNPMGGCLPLFIQLPVVFILYYIVIDPIHYMMGLSNGVSEALTTFATTARAAGGLGLSLTSSNRGTIEIFSQINEEFMNGFANFSYFKNAADVHLDLSALPNFNIGSQNFGLVPQFTSFNILLIVPVLTFLVYFGSMKLTRKFTYQPPQAQDVQTGCSNNMMDIMMPLFSVWIAFTVPAVVGVYWIFKSLLSTLKQFILSRFMPVPKFTEEDYKAAAKAMGGKAAKPEKRYNRETGNPRVRSLHHIDDEDFEDTREKAERRRAAEEELEEHERPAAPKAPASTPEEIARVRMKVGRKREEEEKKKQEAEAKKQSGNKKDADREETAPDASDDKNADNKD